MADNVEIQGLEFQIQENSTGAVAGLENLKKALSGLKGATTSSANGLSKTVKSVKELRNALSGLNSGDVSSKLTRIANGLRALEQVKVSGSLANRLTALNTALSKLKWTDGDKIKTLVDGLKPLTELGRANLTSFLNQLGKLPGVIDELKKADIDKFTQQMKCRRCPMVFPHFHPGFSGLSPVPTDTTTQCRTLPPEPDCSPMFSEVSNLLLFSMDCAESLPCWVRQSPSPTNIRKT